MIFALSASATPPATPSNISLWLIAVAVLGAIALIAYLIPVFQRKCSFDMNKIVPILLECGGIVASVKMMVLAFRIGSLVKNNPVEEIFDAASILIGGTVFLCASAYALIVNILSGYAQAAMSPAKPPIGAEKTKEKG